MEDTKRIIEINGIKLEVDLRNCKRVDEFKVGSPVKILKKKYSDTYESFFGMIVGFDEFKGLPTIIVAYINPSTWETPLQFAYINEKTNDAEICHQENGDIGIERGDVLEQFNRQLAKKEQELKDLQAKKNYFEKMFGVYFDLKEKEQSA
jgi:hypothetical protein